MVQNFSHVAVCPWQRRRACPVGGNADMTSRAAHCAGRSARSAGHAVTPACRVRLWSATSYREDEKDYLHLRWGVTDVFWQWNGKIEELMKWYDQLYNEKKQGGYNPNEEAPTVWAYLQDARWSTIKDWRYYLEWLRVSVVLDDLHEDRLMTSWSGVAKTSDMRHQ